MKMKQSQVRSTSWLFSYNNQTCFSSSFKRKTTNFWL